MHEGGEALLRGHCTRLQEFVAAAPPADAPWHARRRWQLACACESPLGRLVVLVVVVANSIAIGIEVDSEFDGALEARAW